MRKYELFRKDFQVWKNTIHLLPTIEISINSRMYTRKNFSVCFHWLVWHGRLLWLEKEKV